jgi:hypothetical protein
MIWDIIILPAVPASVTCLLNQNEAKKNDIFQNWLEFLDCSTRYHPLLTNTLLLLASISYTPVRNKYILKHLGKESLNISVQL